MDNHEEETKHAVAQSRAEGANLTDKFDTVADELAMFATQIKEFSRGEGALPHPWRIDDWLSDYRSKFARADKVSNAPAKGLERSDSPA